MGSTDKKTNQPGEQEHPTLGKLNLRKKSGQITLVTPPSFFQNQNKSFCLINLSKKDKDSFADALNKHMPDDDLTVYLWDDNNFSSLDPFSNEEDAAYETYLENWKPNAKGRDYTWLLNACRTATTVVINMDYSSNQLKVWSGYILTMAKTYFINSNEDDARAFSVLNRNKVAAVPHLFEKIRRNLDSK